MPHTIFRTMHIIFSLILTLILMGRQYCSHLTNEERKVNRNEAGSPRWHYYRATSSSFKQGTLLEWKKVAVMPGHQVWMGPLQDKLRHRVTPQSYLLNPALNRLASKTHTCSCHINRLPLQALQKNKKKTNEDNSSEEIQITELCDIKICKIIIHSAPGWGLLVSSDMYRQQWLYKWFENKEVLCRGRKPVESYVTGEYIFHV